MLKNSKIKKGIVLKPTHFTEMYYRCLVKLIDISAQLDRDYKFVITYPDHLMKFLFQD